MSLEEKRARLYEILRACGSLAVAFSGGVDSSYLLKAAREVLGDQVLALTAESVFIPRRELAEAEAFCREQGVRLLLAPIDVLSLPPVAENPPDRCYHCKKGIFTKLRDLALAEGFPILAEGSNADDTGDYRPGSRAVRELKVRSPLLEAGLNKSEIRALSKELGLPTWDKPSMACLASRVAYGEALTPEKLCAVERAEEELHRLGFPQCRVRLHGSLARLELPPQEIGRLADDELRRSITDILRSSGFAYATLDLQGYRTGSMNEIISK